jgi:hypothetical protein
MTWIKIDDRILDHEKFVRAVRIGGSEAVHLWFGLRAWCAQNLSDGFVPRDMVAEVRGPKRGRDKALGALVEVGLVEDAGSSWHLHDYLEWSDSREDVLASRRKAAERQKAARGRVTPMSQRDTSVTHAVTTTVSNGGVAPSVTRPPHARTETKTETTPTPQPPNPSGGGKVRCPVDLRLTDGQVCQAEMQGVSLEAVESLTARFRGSWCDRESELRTLDQWRASLNTTVHRDGREETIRLKKLAPAARGYVTEDEA